MSGMSGDHFGIGGGGVMPHPMKEECNACLNLVTKVSHPQKSLVK